MAPSATLKTETLAPGPDQTYSRSGSAFASVWRGLCVPSGDSRMWSIRTSRSLNHHGLCSRHPSRLVRLRESSPGPWYRSAAGALGPYGARTSRANRHYRLRGLGCVPPQPQTQPQGVVVGARMAAVWPFSHYDTRLHHASCIMQSWGASPPFPWVRAPLHSLWDILAPRAVASSDVHKTPSPP